MLNVQMIFMSICKLLLYKIERKSCFKICQLITISKFLKRIASKSQLLFKNSMLRSQKVKKYLLKNFCNIWIAKALKMIKKPFFPQNLSLGCA